MGAIVLSIEEARDWLEISPVRVLRLLPPAKSIPKPLRPERDFLEAEAWRAQGFFSRAEGLYARVLATSSPTQDPALWIEAALGSAAGLRSLGKIEPAKSRLSRVKRLIQQQGLSSYVSRLRLEEAMTDRAAGRYSSSIAALSGILRKNLAAKDWGSAAFALWAIGGAERFRGRLDDSRKAFLRSLKFARMDQDRSGEGYAYFGLGGVTRVLGRLSESARYYASAERVFRKSEDIFARAYACCGLANALRQQGRLSQAEALYRQSHKLYSHLEDYVDLAYVEWGLGQIRLQRGDLIGCLAYLQRALKLFTRHKEARGMVLAQLSLAHALHALGRTARAESLFIRAHRLSRASGLHAHLEIFT